MFDSAATCACIPSHTMFGISHSHCPGRGDMMHPLYQPPMPLQCLHHAHSAGRRGWLMRLASNLYRHASPCWRKFLMFILCCIVMYVRRGVVVVQRVGSRRGPGAAPCQMRDAGVEEHRALLKRLLLFLHQDVVESNWRLYECLSSRALLLEDVRM